MSKQSIYDLFAALELQEQFDVLQELKYMHSNKFNDTYIRVNIYNQNGNISEQIKSQTGYQCYHTVDRSGTIGTNVVLVPRESYTEDIRKQLELAYTNV